MTAAQWEKRLVEAVDHRNHHAARAVTANAEWKATVLDAFDAGLTIPRIAELSGLTVVRIDQVLAGERTRRANK